MNYMLEKGSRFKLFNICNLYILLWLLYNFHWNDVGNFVPMLDAFASVFLGFNLLISLYCTYIVLSKYPLNPFFTAINIILLLFAIYGTFSVLEGSEVYNVAIGASVDSGSYMIGAFRSFTPVYACFLFTELGYINEKTIRIWFWAFLLEAIIINMMMKFSFATDDLLTNNTGYLFVSLFPIVFFYRKHGLFQAFLVCIILFFVVLSIKRGAIFSLGMGVLYLIWYKITHSSSKQKITVIIVVLLLAVIAASFVEGLFEDSEVFQHRYEDTLEGKTSGRDQLASNLLNIYMSSDIMHFIFGFGAEGSIRYGNWAHSDWVEMLFDQGIVGLLSYLFFWLILLRLWRSLENRKSELSLLIGIFFMCNFPRTIFSMWYSMANVFIALPLGYALSHIYGVNKFNSNYN